MNYTSRPLISRLFRFQFLFLLVAGLNAADQTALDNFQRQLTQTRGLSIQFNLTQSGAGENVTTAGQLHIFQPDSFIYATKDVVIRVDHDVIYTYSPEFRNVVVDKYFKDEFNAFAILKGDFRMVERIEVKTGSKQTDINFSVINSSYSGRLTLDNASAKPKSLMMNMGDYGRLEIEVLDLRNINSSALMKQYDRVDGWEVIDLRE